MSYDIENTKTHVIGSGQKYFLDANIWINVLASPINPSHKIKNYLNFFDKLIEKKDVSIVMPALLISEIVNRLIKDIHFIAFAKKNGLVYPNIPKDYYKNVFRPSNDYINSFQLIVDDITLYGDSLEFVNDGVEDDLKSQNILQNIDQHFDFNDNFYYQLALVRKYYIVTDDRDFWREGVKIITGNEFLLNRQIKKKIEEQSGKEVIKYGTFKIGNRIDKPE